MVVAPVIGVVGVAAPFVGDAGAARETDAAIDDEDFSVGAVVEVSPGVKVVPVEGVILLDLGAGFFHLADVVLVDLPAAD